MGFHCKGGTQIYCVKRITPMNKLGPKEIKIK
jgi:hypothetical protein